MTMEPLSGDRKHLADPPGSQSELAELRAELAASNARVNHLRAELQHRVSNLLAVVRSITTRTIEHASTLDELLMHQSGRIDALARVENMLVGSEGRGADLEDILRNELTAVVSASEESRLTIEGPPVSLAPAAAERLAVAFHELTTNALKFGALARPEGRISARWEFVDDGASHLEFVWVESGVPAINSSPKWTGFGSDLLNRALPYDIDARTELRFAPGGLRCKITIPLNARVLAAGRDPGSWEDYR